MTAALVPPVERTVTIALNRADVFRLYTEHMGAWWPAGTHSLGQEKVATIKVETQLGGRIFERWHDGTERTWGTITAWDPPERIVHSWHVSTDPDHASEVEIAFKPLGPKSTLLKLTHRHWERMSGAKAKETRENYAEGWASILSERFAAFAAHQAV